MSLNYSVEHTVRLGDSGASRRCEEPGGKVYSARNAWVGFTIVFTDRRGPFRSAEKGKSRRIDGGAETITLQPRGTSLNSR